MSEEKKAPKLADYGFGIYSLDAVKIEDAAYRSYRDIRASLEEVDQLRETKKQLEQRLAEEKERTLKLEKIFEAGRVLRSSANRRKSAELRRAKADAKEARANATMYRVLLETFILYGYIDLPDPDHKDAIEN